MRPLLLLPSHFETDISPHNRSWLVGGLIFVSERILREIRSRHRTWIHKVILHPSSVVEVQIKVEKRSTRAGQYIMICCPSLSYWEYHPFTLTSAPEEDHIAVHIRSSLLLPVFLPPN